MKTIEPADIIGLCTILACLALIAYGKDSVVTSVLLITVGHFFGRKAKKAE